MFRHIFYTSLVDHGWNDKQKRYFKQYSILKNDKEKNWECGIKVTSLDYDKICIPIHINGNTDHWVLLLVSFMKITHNLNVHLQFYHYDSLNIEETMKGIEDKLMKNDLCKYPNKRPIVKWKLVPFLPQDEFECGARLCQHLTMVWMDMKFNENNSDFLYPVRNFGNKNNSQNVRLWLKFCIKTRKIMSLKKVEIDINNNEDIKNSIKIEGPNEVNGINCCYGHLCLLQNKKKGNYNTIDKKIRRFKKANDNL